MFATVGVLGCLPAGTQSALHCLILWGLGPGGGGHGTSSAQWLVSQILIVQVWPPKALCSLLWPWVIFQIAAALSRQVQSTDTSVQLSSKISVIHEWEITFCYCKLMRVHVWVCVCVYYKMLFLADTVTTRPTHQCGPEFNHVPSLCNLNHIVCLIWECMCFGFNKQKNLRLLQRMHDFGLN